MMRRSTPCTSVAPRMPRCSPRPAALLALVLALGASAGCSGAPPPPPRPVPPPPVDVAAAAALVDRGWGEAVSARFFVAIPLPDLPSWHVDDATGRWLVATHLPSRSILWAREWREGSVVGHAQCEAIARPWRPDLFGPDESALADRRPLPAPAGFDAEVGFAVHRAKDALGGVAVYAAANVRTCLVLAYATRAEGTSAPDVVARRLSFVTEKIFARVRSRSIEERVPAPAR